MKSDLSLSFGAPDDERMLSFRKNEENMKIVQDFVDEIIAVAKLKAEAKLKEKTSSQKQITGTIREPGDLKRRLGARARGFLSRLVDAICHCAHTARAAATR